MGRRDVFSKEVCEGTPKRKSLAAQAKLLPFCLRHCNGNLCAISVENLAETGLPKARCGPNGIQLSWLASTPFSKGR